MAAMIWPISGTVSGRARRRGALGAAQAEADLADELVLGRVGQSVPAVDVADGGAGHVEGGHSGADGGAFDSSPAPARASPT